MNYIHHIYASFQARIIQPEMQKKFEKTKY